jgi:hypothetical protein
MQQALAMSILPYSQIRVQVDGGANRSITNDKSYLLQFRNIKKYPMLGVNADGPALMCTGLGYLPWKADNGEVLLVKTYYAADAAETLVSPTDVVVNNLTNLNAWGQYSNLDTKEGYIQFHRRNNTTPLNFPLTTTNGLWYYNDNSVEDYHPWTCHTMDGNPTIRKLTKAAEFELGHQRWAHPGKRQGSIIHLHADGQPPLRKHAFHRCLTCPLIDGSSRTFNECNHDRAPPEILDWLDDEDDVVSDGLPGQHFRCDFGFMKGTGYCKKDDEGCTITSIDGHRTYFLIVDRKTRYIWVFLNKTKSPPIKIIAQFLREHGNPVAPRRTIRSDKGGELWGCQAFQDAIQEAGYILEPTAPYAPFQNGMAE